MNRQTFIHNIRRATIFHMLPPVMFLILLLLLLIQIPIINCIFPTVVSSSDNISDVYSSSTYVECHADTIYYTGYDYMLANRVKGHYYYSLEDNRCTIYLLSSGYVRKMGEFPKIINNVTFRARLMANSSTIRDLLTLMASDMNWTYSGISAYSSAIIVSEMNYSVIPVIIMGLIVFFALIFTSCHIILISFDFVRPMQASVFSNIPRPVRRNTIEHACRELEGCHNIYENVYITADFVVYASHNSLLVIPVDDIVQIYYYNTVHGLPMRRHVTASVIIITSKRPARFRLRYIHPDDADNIVNTITQHNPDIISELPAARPPFR